MDVEQRPQTSSGDTNVELASNRRDTPTDGRQGRKGNACVARTRERPSDSGDTPVKSRNILRVATCPSSARLKPTSQDPEQFSLVHPESKKRYFPVRGVDAVDAADSKTTHDSRPNTPSLPLRLILIVEDADETSIVPIPGAESLIKLIANVYLASYLPPDHSPILMQRAASLIQRGVRVKALRRAKEPGRLLEIVEAIEREVANTRLDSP